METSNPEDLDVTHTEKPICWKGSKEICFALTKIGDDWACQAIHGKEGPDRKLRNIYTTESPDWCPRKEVDND